MLSENVQVLNQYPECTVQQAANFPDSSAPAKAAQVKTNSQPVISLPLFSTFLDSTTLHTNFLCVRLSNRLHWLVTVLRQRFAEL